MVPTYEKRFIVSVYECLYVSTALRVVAYSADTDVDPNTRYKSTPLAPKLYTY